MPLHGASGDPMMYYSTRHRMTVTMPQGDNVTRCPMCRHLVLVAQHELQVTCGRCGGIITVRWEPVQTGPRETK